MLPEVATSGWCRRNDETYVEPRFKRRPEYASVSNCLDGKFTTSGTIPKRVQPQYLILSFSILQKMRNQCELGPECGQEYLSRCIECNFSFRN